MKKHWFSALSLAGIVLLSGQAFGGELQWKKPGNSEPATSAVIRIPSVITTDDTAVPSALPSPVRQVQAVQPIQVPPRPATPSASQLDMRYPELRPQNVPVPPGATIQSLTPIPQQNIPDRVREQEQVPRQNTSERTARERVQVPRKNAAEQPGERVQVPQQNIPVQVREQVQISQQNIPVRVGESVSTPCDDQVPLKSIREISHDIRPVTEGELPEECVMNSKPFDGRHFSQSCVQWKASAVCTKAAYFEDVQLERYGHTIVCPALQPIVSGAKFFATVPFLPYKMGVTPPNECVYTLGHYRTGNRSPYMVQPVPISARGVLFQAGAIVGGAAAIP